MLPESLSSRSEAPVVRAVVVNYNGGLRSVCALDSLRALQWPADHLDVVLVDNASTDGVASLVRRSRPDVRVIQAGANLGFGAACNLGIGDLSGVDFVALLNPDATVEPDWLWRLAEAHQADPRLASACPKVLFDVPFLEIEVDSPTSTFGLGDQRSVGVLVSGARVESRDVSRRVQFVRGFWGPEPDGPGGGPAQWSGAAALLRLPVEEKGVRHAELLLSAVDRRQIRLASGEHETLLEVGAHPRWHTLALGGDAVDVINSVGVTLLEDGYAADRGWLERDSGQWNEPAEVPAWSGAAVLLSAEHLRQLGTFEERLFLYYEDIELSLRAARAGWRHKTVPSAVTRHFHSAIVIEGSAVHQYFSERNRLIVLTRYAAASAVVALAGRFLLITASYARRDGIARLLRGAPPCWYVPRMRLSALLGFVRALPWILEQRRSDGLSRGSRSSASAAGVGPLHPRGAWRRLLRRGA